MDCVLPEIYRQIPRHLLETQLLLNISPTRMRSVKHLWWKAYPRGQSMVAADRSDLTLSPILTISLGQHMKNVSRNSTPQQPWLLSHCRVKGRVEPSLQTALSGLACLDFTEGGGGTSVPSPLFPNKLQRTSLELGVGKQSSPVLSKEWCLTAFLNCFVFLHYHVSYLPPIYFPLFPMFLFMFSPFLLFLLVTHTLTFTSFLRLKKDFFHTLHSEHSSPLFLSNPSHLPIHPTLCLLSIPL